MFDLLHSFVNIFASGRSDAKVVLFFCYVFLLVLLTVLCKRKHLVFKPVFSDVKKNKLRITSFGLLVVGYVYGLLLHIYYSLSNNLSLGNFLVTSANGELSSTTLTHTHEMKGSIAAVLSLFGDASFRTIDAGGAYLGQLPLILLLLGSGIIGLLLLSTALYFLYVMLPYVKNLTVRRSLLIVTLFALVSFSLVKSVIDGGILSPNVIAIIIAATMVWFYRNDKNTIYYLLIGSTVLCAVMIWLQSIDTSITYLSSIVAFVLLLAVLFYAAEETPRLQTIIPLIVLFFASWLLASGRDVAIYQYGDLELKKGQEYHVYDEQSGLIRTEKTSLGGSIKDLAARHGKNLTYSPITSPGVTCFASGPKSEIVMRVRSGDAVSRDDFKARDSRFISLTHYTRTGSSGIFMYDLTLELDRCTPELLGSLSGYLTKSGLRSYIIINPKIDGRDQF